MKSVAELLQPMKDRLAAATPGPWHLDRDEPGEVASVVAYAHNDGVTIGTYVADTVEQDGDAELIAHAPTDQAKLMAAIEAMEELCVIAETHADGTPRATANTIHPDAIRVFLTQALGGDTA